jgi:UDP-N-acetylmuramoyl-tripeptide--D-alanyl-D-alanine ligase
MINLTLSEAARLLNASLLGEDISFTSVSTDSRNLQTGDLFVALSGPNFDGHNYLPQAQQAGAPAAMVQRIVETELPLLLVEDTLKGLGALASIWREKSRALVAAITGSNGKTTVKEMLAAIMARKGKVLATKGNLNNEIGLPLTLLRLQDEEYAVVEMGANHHGEIDALTRIAKPDLALITNAGRAHLEGFGSVDGVAKAKGEIINGLGESGTFVLNADDSYADVWRDLAGSRSIVSFGFDSSADVSTSKDRLRSEWREDGFYNCFSVQTPNGDIEVELGLAGIHNCKNALAAIAMAGVMGAGCEEIRDGLKDVKPVKGRLCPLNGIDGIRVIDDSYNANPDSVSAAIDVLTGMTGAGQRSILVLGELAEVGTDVDQVYQQLGEKAREAGVDQLYAAGAAAKVATSFGDGGYGYDDKEQLLEQLKNNLRSGDMVLVKGSRTAAMESVVYGLSPGEGN